MLAVALVRLYAAWLQFQIGGERATTAVSNVGQLAAATVAAVSCARQALSVSGRWACGQLLWARAEPTSALPFPSWADAGFLMFPVLALAGLLVRPSVVFHGRGRPTTTSTSSSPSPGISPRGGSAQLFNCCSAWGIELRGHEALARWSYNGQPVAPDVFIPIAERAGLLPRLDMTVTAWPCHASPRSPAPRSCPSTWVSGIWPRRHWWPTWRR